VILEVTAQDVGVDIVRVEYDVAAAMRAIVASELPDDFADQLRAGGAARDAART
jgi:hypothetical protein